MQVIITFRQMEATEALKQHINQKLEKVAKFLVKPVDVHVFLSTERYLHRAEIKIEEKHFSAHAVEESDDMYASIDRAVSKIGKSLKKHKDKLKDPKAHGASTNPTTS